MPDWLKLSHHLPYPLRAAAASAKGYYLRWWRYGPETERLVEEALEREAWPPERWKAWQEERLAQVLHRARHQVPYYRAYWDERERRGERGAWQYLENWPVLKKEVVRAQPLAFLADDCNPRRMYHLHTSGTTGSPLTLWIGRRSLQYWYALFEARCRRWYGVSRRDRWAIIGGQLVADVRRGRPPFWVWNAGLNQLYLSAYHLAPANVRHYVQALTDHRVRYLWGYSSALHALADLAVAQGLELPALQVVISNAEPLYDFQRQTIAQAFRCPVRATYGMAEMVAGATECEAALLHLWPDAGVVEVLSDERDEPAPAGKVGRLICTGLVNRDMPLVRYGVGDRGALEPALGPCACGRTLPQVRSVEGRLDAVILTSDGRRIGRLDPVFKADMPVREAQIIQESLTLVRVRVVPADGYSSDTARLITERLRQRVGDRMDIEIEEVEHIPRGPNGKFRMVISKVASG
ncbi:MAG: phenylacetate--CoA ligase family protein [Anaerolineae bacterium]